MQLSLTIQCTTLALVFGLAVKGLHEHKVWIRAKDRLNTLWSKHCKETGERFVSLDGNGK